MLKLKKITSNLCDLKFEIQISLSLIVIFSYISLNLFDFKNLKPIHTHTPFF